MSDHDRERETVRDTDRTTIIRTDGDRDRGGSGVLIAVVLIIALLGLLFFLFGGSFFNRAADNVGVNVNVAAPKIDVPDINVKVPDNVKVDLPDVKVKTDDKSAGNTSQ